MTAAGARFSDARLGPMQVVGLLRVQSGPCVEVVVRANITVPDVRIAPDVLDYGAVLLGQEKTMSFQLHNVTPVPVQWSVILPPPLPAHNPTKMIRDRDAFRVEPASGSLAPGERCVVSTTFTPAELRQFSTPLGLRIAQNSKQRFVGARGAGVDVGLAFSVPKALPPPGTAIEDITLPPPSPAVADPLTSSSLTELGPQLPGARPSVRVITITNTSSVPVEIYSADYDLQAKREEHVLAALAESAFDEAGFVRVPFRAPGEPLPAKIVQVRGSRVYARQGRLYCLLVLPSAAGRPGARAASPARRRRGHQHRLAVRAAALRLELCRQPALDDLPGDGGDGAAPPPRQRHPLAR